MAYDPDLQPFLDALAALTTHVNALTARVDVLEKLPEPEKPADPPTPPVVLPPPAPAIVSLNRKLVGVAIPDGEILNDTAAQMTRINSVGFKAIRFDLRYETIQSQGLAHYDGIIRTLRAAGIHILAILGGNLKFATETEQRQFADHAAQVVAWLAARGVHHVQIGNEWNHASRVTTPENYTAALRLAYPAMKRANPNVFVVGNGLSAIPTTEGGHIGAIDYVRRCYAAGAKGFYDALAVHPYSYPYSYPYGLNHAAEWTGMGVMKGLRDLMAANGESHLKIWATEIGFPATGEVGYTEADQNTLFARQLVTEMNKLAWLGPAFVYSLKDRTGDILDRENVFGLYRANGAAKPAVAVIRTAVAAFPPLA